MFKKTVRSNAGLKANTITRHTALGNRNHYCIVSPSITTKY